MIRRIIKIDEEKCNGCGACATACHEGAIDMINGKAVLTRENYCDGLGDCLPNCPTGAITFEEREAPAYDEAAVKAAQDAKAAKASACGCPWRTGKNHRLPKRSSATGSDRTAKSATSVASTDQAGASECALFRWRQAAHCGRLHSLCLWQFPPGIYSQPCDAHRLPKTGCHRLQ